MIRREDMSAESWAAMCTPINEILPVDEQKRQGGLFIGSWFASVDRDLLNEYGIRQVVAVLGGSMAGEPPIDGLGAYKVPIEDSTTADLKPHLAGACDFIAEKLGKGDNVLVHCQQGISRSAAIVIAYLMRDKGMGYDEALQTVKSKRMCVKPNTGFERTLRNWEKEGKR